MSRGVKMDLSLGGNWNNGWSMEQEESSKHSSVLEPRAHRLVFQKEKRKGKIVTLVGPFSLNDEEVNKHLSLLKKSLACGGTYKEGWMEFQGDISDKIREKLKQEGFGFKSSK